jgi:SAM-dependent methyltransferase
MSASTRIKNLIRKKDIELAFEGYQASSFQTGLEIGAGDGYQSHLLLKYIKRLTCTEYYEDSFSQSNMISGVEYRTLDVSDIDEHFANRKFDIIFSSNVLEHITSIESVIPKFGSKLKDNGIMIHVMPNRTWKFLHILIWYFMLPNIIRKKLFNHNKSGVKRDFEWKKSGNNPNASQIGVDENRRVLSKLFPTPHGVSVNNFSEYLSFGKKFWIKVFENSGFEVVEVRKLQFHTPYRFNCALCRSIFTWIGLASSYAYYIRKRKQ